ERSTREAIEALEARAREQQSQFEVQLAQERLEHENRVADMDAAHRALAFERDSLRQNVASLEERVTVLKNDARSVPDLRKQLDASRAESDRLFEHAGIAMFRCTREGALIQANRACTTLVGRRTNDELHGVDFGAVVFEAPNVFSWLIERCVSSRAKES